MNSDDLDEEMLKSCKEGFYDFFINGEPLTDTFLGECWNELNNKEHAKLGEYIRSVVYELVDNHTLNSDESIKNFDYHNFRPFSIKLFIVAQTLFQYSQAGTYEIYPLVRMIENVCLGGINRETNKLKNAVESPLLSDIDKTVLQAFIDGQSNLMEATVAAIFINDYYHEKDLIKLLSTLPNHWLEVPSLLATQAGLDFLDVQKSWYEAYCGLKTDQRSLMIERAISQADYSRGLPVKPIPESKFQQYKKHETKLATIGNQLQMATFALSQNPSSDLSQIVREFQNQSGEGPSAKIM